MVGMTERGGCKQSEHRVEPAIIILSPVSLMYSAVEVLFPLLLHLLFLTLSSLCFFFVCVIHFFPGQPSGGRRMAGTMKSIPSSSSSWGPPESVSGSDADGLCPWHGLSFPLVPSAPHHKRHFHCTPEDLQRVRSPNHVLSVIRSFLAIYCIVICCSKSLIESL